MALARNILPPFHNKSVKGLGILERLVSENVHVFAIPMGATGHTCVLLVTTIPPTPAIPTALGPAFGSRALRSCDDGHIVIATL